MTASDDDTSPSQTDAQAHPEEAVDALEDRVLGGTVDQTRDDDEDEDEDEDATPAFEQDLDSEDQGSAAAGDEQPG